MSRFSPIKSKQSPLEVQPEVESIEYSPPTCEPTPDVAPDVAVTFKPNPAKNGLHLYFSHKPDEAIRSELKAAGWRWSFRNQCWYHLDTPANRDFAEQFVARFTPVAPFTEPLPVANEKTPAWRLGLTASRKFAIG